MDPFSAFLILVVTSLISLALAPKPPTPKPPPLAEVSDVPTAEEGHPIPVVFGAVLLRGANVVWYGDLAAEPIKKKSKGKK